MASVAPRNVAALVADPHWLPLRLSQDRAQIRFVRLDRQAFAAATFLEERYLPAGAPTADVPVSTLLDAANDLAPPTPRFIFHSSMATSTLLTRAFDSPGASMALSEPIILNQLSALHSRGEDVAGLLDLFVRLLARPFGEGELTVIKPGNTANNLMPGIADRFPATRALTIAAPVRELLGSVAKRGANSRMIYRRLYAFISRTRQLATGFTPEDEWELTDLQVAAMAWLLQHSEFAEMLRSHPDLFRSASSAEVIDDPAGTLAALAAFFGIALDSEAVAAGPVFAEHSKARGTAFDGDARKREREQLDLAYGDEIAAAAEWVEDVAARVGVPLVLPNPLLHQ